MADKIIRYLHITYPTNLGYNVMNLASMEASITVATWESRKKKLSAIQKEASDKLSEVTVGYVFSQGTIKHLDQAPEIPYFQKGSTMWWVSKTGHFQYEIVSQ